MANFRKPACTGRRHGKFSDLGRNPMHGPSPSGSIFFAGVRAHPPAVVLPPGTLAIFVCGLLGRSFEDSKLYIILPCLCKQALTGRRHGQF